MAVRGEEDDGRKPEMATHPASLPAEESQEEVTLQGDERGRKRTAGRRQNLKPLVSGTPLFLQTAL